MKNKRKITKKESHPKRLKANNDWDLYENLFIDEYRMYMYFAKNLTMNSSIMSAFHQMWISKKMLYTVLEMQFEKYGWRISRVTSYFFGPYHIIGQKDDRRFMMKVLGIVTKEIDGDSLVVEFYTHGFSTLKYKWDDKTTILESLAHEWHTIGMSAFVNGLINMIMD